MKKTSENQLKQLLTVLPRRSKIILMIVSGVALLATVFILIGLVITRPKEDESVVLVINGEEVRLNEAMVYWELMDREFEKLAGTVVWDLDMLGLDPSQTEVDRVMESIIRVKLAQGLAGSVKSYETAEIEERTDQLESLLGASFLYTNHISREMLEKIVQENYLASRYESGAHFRTSEFEEDIAEGLEKEFGDYDLCDKEVYLSKVTLIPMMFYTGQFSGDTWISYPESQKLQIYEKVQTAVEGITAQTFYRIALTQADTCSVVGNPLFEQGLIRYEYMQRGCLYRGQIDSEVEEILATMEPGEISPIIETEYGYLVFLVSSFTEAYESDYSSFESQLEAAKVSYEQELISELKQQRMEEEWQRLEEEAEIIRYRDRMIR